MSYIGCGGRKRRRYIQADGEWAAFNAKGHPSEWSLGPARLCGVTCAHLEKGQPVVEQLDTTCPAWSMWPGSL